VHESTKTIKKSEAQRYEEQRKKELTENLVFGVNTEKTWLDAELLWMKEMQHKRTILQDVQKFKYLEFLQPIPLSQINRSLIQDIITKLNEKNVKPATINRYLALIRAVLNKAYREWEWIDKVPAIKLLKENNYLSDYLTPDQVFTLLNDPQLPEHLKLLIEMAILTGQRKSNLLSMEWDEISLQYKLWIIPPQKFKTNKIHSVPLSDRAIELIKSQIGKHPKYVFSYKGNVIKECNTKAYRNALKRAGIMNVKRSWHLLRHTSASWLAQNGEPLDRIQELFGWTSVNMVMRYRHLNKDNLLDTANKIGETFYDHQEEN
jgi:integrase